MRSIVKSIVIKTNLIFVFLVLLFTGCSRVSTLNQRPHSYGLLPTKIIWMQIAGLDEEHLAMLRFTMSNTEEKTSFEKASCIGKVWNYNLYNLRPGAFDGFWSQLTGKKNLKGNCEDFQHNPLWQYLVYNGYESGIFESGTDASLSLEKINQCPEISPSPLNQAILWKMQKRESSGKGPEKVQDLHSFHLYGSENGGVNFMKGKIYYDSSCQTGVCYSSLSRNIEYVFDTFKKNKTHYLFILRDFSFAKALKEGNYSLAKERLSELERIHGLFLNLSQQEYNLLVLVTSTAPQRVEFPLQGEPWAQLEKGGKGLLYKNPSLLSPVFASGARGENFCGLYEEAELFTRLTQGFLREMNLPFWRFRQR